VDVVRAPDRPPQVALLKGAVARFLSPEWFSEVEAESAPEPSAPDDDPEGTLVLEQVVTGTPYGEVRYRVAAGGGRARIEPSGHGERAADLTITCDWPTASSIAQGTLSTQTALTEGRLRVRGSLVRLARGAGGLSGLDPVPAEVRKTTTF
jgi:hypothetical protein